MQLIEITTVPLEYKLRIKNAELRLAEAEKNRKDAYKDAYNAAEKKASGIGENMTVVKPGYVPESNKTDLSENKTESDVTSDNNDTVLKLLSEYDAENASTLEAASQSVASPDFTLKLKSEFENRLPVNQYIEFSNKIYGKFDNKESQLELIEDNMTKYQQAKKRYMENSKELEFIRGEVSMEILTKPRVDISYIGGFMYVPPSSDPNYEEPFYEKTA